MRYNYQIMTKKNGHGSYMPDMEALRTNATCQEEIDYINKVESDWERYKGTFMEKCIGFTFNMCYVMRQACGHFEIFQSHAKNDAEALEWLNTVAERAEKNRCSRCICGRAH